MLGLTKIFRFHVTQRLKVKKAENKKRMKCVDTRKSWIGYKPFISIARQFMGMDDASCRGANRMFYTVYI